MTPLSIAAVQMSFSASHSNVEAMCDKVDVVMHLYPWVQMVLLWGRTHLEPNCC